MGAVAEGSPSIRAQANLTALGQHEMAPTLPHNQTNVPARAPPNPPPAPRPSSREVSGETVRPGCRPQR